jgi:hypothetical protein
MTKIDVHQKNSPFLVLNRNLDIVDCVRRLNLESDRLSGQGLDEDLYTATQAKDQVKSGLFLDIVVREGKSIF